MPRKIGLLYQSSDIPFSKLHFIRQTVMCCVRCQLSWSEPVDAMGKSQPFPQLHHCTGPSRCKSVWLLSTCVSVILWYYNGCVISYISGIINILLAICGHC